MLSSIYRSWPTLSSRLSVMCSFSSVVLVAFILMISGALSFCYVGPSTLETTSARVPPESSAIDRDILDDKFHVLASQIKSKIETENNIPIFEFGKDIAAAVDLAQSLVDSTGSLFKLELLYNEYMGKLRDYYLIHFRRSSGIDEPMGSGHKEKDLERYKEKSLAECEKAMKSATLDKSTYKVTWSYDVR